MDLEDHTKKQGTPRVLGWSFVIIGCIFLSGIWAKPYFQHMAVMKEESLVLMHKTELALQTHKVDLSDLSQEQQNEYLNTLSDLKSELSETRFWEIRRIMNLSVLIRLNDAIIAASKLINWETIGELKKKDYQFWKIYFDSRNSIDTSLRKDLLNEISIRYQTNFEKLGKAIKAHCPDLNCPKTQ